MKKHITQQVLRLWAISIAMKVKDKRIKTVLISRRRGIYTAHGMNKNGDIIKERKYVI